jgi:hypothetical protein
VRPSSALEIAAGDFALAADHRLTAISRGLLHRGGLSGAQPDGLLGDLVDTPPDRFRRLRLLCHPRSIGRELCTLNSVGELARASG